MVYLLVTILTAAGSANTGDGAVIEIPTLPDPAGGGGSVLQADPVRPLTSIELRETSLCTTRDPIREAYSADGLLGSLTCQQTLRDGPVGTVWDDPLSKRGWQADQSWKMALFGPISVFSQASAAADDQLRDDARMNGRTGLAFQLPLPAGDIVLRGGPNLTCSDPLHPDRTKEHSEMLLEVKARHALLFGVNLEFQGTASPALTPFDRDWITQEVRLALPLGVGGQLQLGARQRWDNFVEQRPTTDGPQLFLGFELKH